MHRAIDDATKTRMIDAIARYCQQVLEPPNRVFSNKPACPFSRREREADKIQYEFVAIVPEGPSSEVVQTVREFAAAGAYTTLLLVDPEQCVGVEEAVNYGVELSRQCRQQQIVAISVHPDDDYAIAGFQPRSGVPYVMMLCQAAAYLREAKKQLEGTGYYANWSQLALEYNFKQIGQFL
jgi:hypothetical protein